MADTECTACYAASVNRRRSNRMKKLLIVIAMCLCCSAALADYDPVPDAYDVLKTVYGYTQEEADAFCMEYLSDHELAYYLPEHPEWLYTTTFTKYGVKKCNTPFQSRHSEYQNEGALREFLREAWDKQWFINWSADTRNVVAEAVNKAGITPRRELSLALITDNIPPEQLIQAIFTSCYGVEPNWTAALVGWRNEVLTQYGVSLSPIFDVPESGIIRYVIPVGLNSRETAVCEFRNEIPEELEAFIQIDPHLDGWTCVTGTIFRLVEYPSTRQADIGTGLAAFEKDGQHMLVVLKRMDDEWKFYPIGNNALEQNSSALLSITASNQINTNMNIRYDSNDGMHTFDVSIRTVSNALYDSAPLCYMETYEEVSVSGSDRVYIDMSSSRNDEWTFIEQHNSITKNYDVVVNYPACMGVMDVMDMPRNITKAQAMVSPIPEGYALTTEVHLRKDHSSRAADLGTLQAGTLIRVQDTVSGDPFPWIRTTLGLLRGYVCEQYTTVSSEPASFINHAPPLAVAEAKHDIRLKSGTGWFDRTIQQFSAGTRMRVIMDKGSWIYVVVPREEYPSDWLMDVNGVYGYIKKSDVSIAALGIQLDWQ